MNASEYPTCKRTYATLRIYPETLDPPEVTARLGIEPSEWQRLGQNRKQGTRLAKLNGWFLGTSDTVESVDVRKHLDWLLERLVPRAEAILALQADGCAMDVSCYWVSRSGHGGPSIRPDQMRDFGRLNLEVWFDVYLGDADDSEPRVAPEYDSIMWHQGPNSY